ncbi:hypothetical protein N9W79_01245 [bacterium]|nr:hypothetical protein [bacterium]
MTQTSTCIIVSHTHWDRAWYLPFEAFRFRMVETVDTVLDQLSNSSHFKSFTLDGQSVLLEDYLEIRPEKKRELEILIRSKMLSVGPWYTLPDVFLSGGESLIRNLMLGIDLGKKFGGYLKVGYVPDPFGHISQMPQILKGFELEGYLFMRGQPHSVTDDVFNWVSPDGSSITAVNLKLGYFFGSALGHPDVFGRYDGHEVDKALALKTVEKYFKEEKTVSTTSTTSTTSNNLPVLICNGGDHMPVQPEIPEIMETLKESYPDMEWIHGDFDQYITKLHESNPELTSYSGELMGNKDHPILANVFSSRVYLKKLHHESQSLLTRYLEPILAFAKTLGIKKDYSPFTERAWKILLKCQAHDDIGGCSIDEVHEHNEASFKKILALSNELIKDVLERAQKIGFSLAAENEEILGKYFVFNPHPYATTEHLDLKLLISKEDEKTLAKACFTLVDDKGSDLDFRLNEVQENSVRNNFLETTNGTEYRFETTVELPPLGYKVLLAKKAPKAKQAKQILSNSQTSTIENSLYKIGHHNQKLVLHVKSLDFTLDNFIKIIFEPDTGDTYTFGPQPEAGSTEAVLEEVISISNRENRLLAKYRLSVPANFKDQTGPKVEVLIEAELFFGAQGSVSVTVNYHNNLPNSRLRLHFATGLTETSTLADGHFSLESRDVLHPKPDYSPREPAYPGEVAYPTNFQGDFVILPGKTHSLWVANKGLHEYETVTKNNLSEIAITLHRAVGALSVNGGGIRSCHAGPGISTPGAQCLRELTHELSFGVAQSPVSSIVQKARAFSHPCRVFEMPRLPFVKAEKSESTIALTAPTDSLLTIENDSVQLSSYRYCPKKEVTILRLYNNSSEITSSDVLVHVSFSKFMSSDLFETWSDESASDIKNHRLNLRFRAGEIKTILLNTSKDLL